MIPKIIHYCWFGKSEKPKLVQNCIESWMKYCPDYKIIEWNEDNFDINKYEYTKYYYQKKKWAFVSDFARLVAVFENGGIYFDTDVEVIRPFDDLLNLESFFGFENEKYVATGLGFGGEKGCHSIGLMIEQYLSLVPRQDGSFNDFTCPKINTESLIKIGLVRNGSRQELEGASIFPVEYFNPLDDSTGKLVITENTYSINHYGKSWMSKRLKLRSKLTRPLHRLFGTDFFRKH